jgi:hypothetical protein
VVLTSFFVIPFALVSPSVVVSALLFPFVPPSPPPFVLRDHTTTYVPFPLVPSCLSCLVLSCLVLSCLVLSCLVLSCLVLSCLVLSCLVWLDSAFTSVVLSLWCYSVFSCLMLSLVLSCSCPTTLYAVTLRLRPIGMPRQLRLTVPGSGPRNPFNIGFTPTLSCSTLRLTQPVLITTCVSSFLFTSFRCSS